jgi:hypothetical protein
VAVSLCGTLFRMTPATAWLCGYLAALTADADPPTSPPIDWDALAAVAEAERLVPALAFGFARHPDATVPGAVAARLAARFNVAVARHVVMSRDLATVLRALDEAAIPTIVLKGAYLGETVYPHPALRPMSDIDVLVRHGDRLRMDEVLRGLGYRRGTDAHSWAFDVTYDAATFYDGPGGARLDVHWRLLNDPRFGWRPAAAEAVWDRAVPVKLAGARALALCPEDLVLTLAAHLAVHHGLSGLLWYWDLRLVLDRWAATLDWRELMELAERWRVRRALSVVLRRLGDFFPVPDAVDSLATRIAPRGPRTMAARWLVTHGRGRTRGFEHWLPLLLTDRPLDLLRVLGPAICPSPAWVRARYGVASLRRAYGAHAARMATIVRLRYPLSVATKNVALRPGDLSDVRFDTDS